MGNLEDVEGKGESSRKKSRQWSVTIPKGPRRLTVTRDRRENGVSYLGKGTGC